MTNLVKENQKPKICCPDCGAELQATVHLQADKPYHSFLYFYCPGRCHAETCSQEGIAPEKVPNGTPKFYVLLSQERESKERIMAKADIVLEQLSIQTLDASTK